MLNGEIRNARSRLLYARQVELLSRNVVRSKQNLLFFIENDDVGMNGIFHAAEQRVLHLFGPVRAERRTEDTQRLVVVEHGNRQIDEICHAPRRRFFRYAVTNLHFSNVRFLDAFLVPLPILDIPAFANPAGRAFDPAVVVCKPDPGIVGVCRLKTFERRAQGVGSFGFGGYLRDLRHVIERLQALEHRTVELVLHFVREKRERSADLQFQTLHRVVRNDVGNRRGEQQRYDRNRGRDQHFQGDASHPVSVFRGTCRQPGTQSGRISSCFALNLGMPADRNAARLAAKRPSQVTPNHGNRGPGRPSGLIGKLLVLDRTAE